MAYIRITSITPGTKGTTKFGNRDQLHYQYAHDVGLLRHSAWLHDVKVGDCLIVPYKELEDIRKNGKGVFEFKLEHPKYANHSVGSDTYPYEVIEWLSETKVKVREMDTEDYTDFGEHCNKYISNPKNLAFVVREHKNGGLFEPGTNSCPYILSDKPYYRRDPNY